MHSKLVSFLFALTLMSLGSVAFAQNYYGDPTGTMAPAASTVRTPPPQSYGEGVGLKLGSGLANMTLGWIEVPKNIINTSNQVNLVLGFTGGLAKGVLHMLGRTIGGTVDLLTSPFPLKPIVQPPFVWENFEVETSYGPSFKPQ